MYQIARKYPHGSTTKPATPYFCVFRYLIFPPVVWRKLLCSWCSSFLEIIFPLAYKQCNNSSHVKKNYLDLISPSSNCLVFYWFLSKNLSQEFPILFLFICSTITLFPWISLFFFFLEPTLNWAIVLILKQLFTLSQMTFPFPKLKVLIFILTSATFEAMRHFFHFSQLFHLDPRTALFLVSFLPFRWHLFSLFTGSTSSSYTWNLESLNFYTFFPLFALTPKSSQSDWWFAVSMPEWVPMFCPQPGLIPWTHLRYLAAYTTWLLQCQ